MTINSIDRRDKLRGIVLSGDNQLDRMTR